MKNSKGFVNILILLGLNILLILFDYYIGIDLFKIISDEWYVIVLVFFINALFVNPFISYLIDYYLILIHI